jgi:hypothetical protein
VADRRPRRERLGEQQHQAFAQDRQQLLAEELAEGEGAHGR